MNQKELTEYNIGENLDTIMNLDPRGYGVCRILYEASRRYTKEPLSMHAAKELVHLLEKDDIVYIITGFVLIPHKKAEMDGIISSMLLARALVKAFEAKPIILCPTDNIEAVRALSKTVGLHLYETVEEVKEYPVAMGVLPFTKDSKQAEIQSEEILAKGLPKAVISIEAPGRNALGVYHNATGNDVTEYEAKTDLLFEKLQQRGVWNLAIGDLGNELGMGTIAAHLKQFVPYAKEGRCSCGCEGGIAAVTQADHILTATVSDWGCYAMIAAIAFLKRDMDIMHTEELEREAMMAASNNGMIDMYGWLVPAIDGFELKINEMIVGLMRECISYPLKLEKTCKTWFEKTLELQFFESRE